MKTFWIRVLLPDGYRGYSGPGVKLNTHLHLAPSLRMIGAIPPLPKYAFVAWCSFNSTGTNLPLPFYLRRGDHFEDLGVEGKIILEWMLGK